MKILAHANPISFPGFRTLLRGESCEVPDEHEAGARRLVEWGSATDVTHAPKPIPAPASAAPAAPAEDTESAELARLQAELDALEGAPAEDEPSAPAPARGKRAVECAHCGKVYTDHAKGRGNPVPDVACNGLRRGFKPPAAVAAE